MTPTARTVLPTDLVALVSYDGRVYANQAMTRDRTGTEDSPHPLETAFEQWLSFATGRHTCVSVKGPTLRGLVSARRRGSKLAWEIDCLINAAEGDGSVLTSLLDRITSAAGRSGGLRIFVRLAGGAEAASAVARCAFVPYLEEDLLRRGVQPGEDLALPPGLRRRAKADLYPLFQLYNAIAPAEVRRFEGLTFAEWNAGQENLGKTSHFVLERDGRLAGWLRVAGDGELGRFDVLGEHASLDELIQAGMAKVANRKTACVLVPSYQEAVRLRLEALGFQRASAYTTFARRTVHTVKAAKRVAPALVHTTFG